MGGKAVKNVTRINQENVQPTLDYIYKTLLPYININKNDTSLLGSTGKKLPGGSSGDIDLAINYNAIIKKHESFDNWLYRIIQFCKTNNYDYNWMQGLNVFSIAVPIISYDDSQDGDFVQLDLMPVKNINMTSWGMHSPHESEEPWKGLVRNNLICAVAAVTTYKSLSTSIDKNGDEVTDTSERLTFDPMTGLRYIKQSRISPKTGKLMSTKKTVNAYVVEEDPKKIAKKLFNCSPSEILTTKGVIKQIMSDKFPYKSKRQAIFKKAQTFLRNLGASYPEIIDKYADNMIIKENTEDSNINTPRKALTKIHQMKPAQFVKFIKLLKSKLKGNKLDLSELNSHEKADGQAVRIIVVDGKIGLETSHSGVQFKAYKLPQSSFQNTLKYFQKELSDELLQMEASFGMGYKLMGELFYTNDLNIIDDDGSVTFVGTKYDNAKLGKMGAVIVYDAYGIKDGQIIDLPDNKRDELIKGFKRLANDTMQIFDFENFAWNKTLELQINYDTPDIRDIFENPDQLLEKENKQVFADFRDMIAKAFSDEITKNGSVLGVPGSTVEGIVFHIGDEEYGATNFDWKKVKANNDRYQTAFEDTIGNFYKSIFGAVQLRKLQTLVNQPDADEIYEDKWAQALPGMKFKIDKIVDDFYNDNSLPRQVKQKFSFFLGNAYRDIQKFDSTLDSFREYLNRKVKPLKK